MCIRDSGEPGHHKVEGIGVSFVPRTFDREWCDEIIAVNDPEAFAMVKRLAAEEGLLSGSSGGAIIDAAVQIAARLGKGKMCIRDSGITIARGAVRLRRVTRGQFLSLIHI